jgi:glycosyltransferase involved in cell wall biosynthesis
MPRVSLIMTVRNGERYLSNALSSLLSQSFSDIEIIVTNNGSTDSTAEILASVNDPRLKIISVDPFLNSTFASGILKAFNVAIGEFVAVQDSDDISEKCRIEKQVHFLETHPSVGLVGSNFEFINEYDEHLWYSEATASSNKLMQQYAVGNQLAHSTIMFRRKIADANRDLLRFNKIPLRKDEPTLVLGNNSKAKKMLGWSAYNLNQMLFKALQEHKRAI